jgi:hypothetical protein
MVRLLIFELDGGEVSPFSYLLLTGLLEVSVLVSEFVLGCVLVVAFSIISVQNQHLGVCCSATTCLSSIKSD